MQGAKRGRKARTVSTVLAAVSMAGIVSLMGGFYASNRQKSCEEERTRKVLIDQHTATATVITMLLQPKKVDPRTGDYDDALYEPVQRALESRRRFFERVSDDSCARWDPWAQWGLCLSGVFQILAGAASVLLAPGD